MNVSAYTRASSTVRLDKHERFVAYNDKGYPFHTREILYMGGEKVVLRGFAIKTDGDEGVMQRDCTKILTSMSPEVQQALVREFKASVQQMLNSAADLTPYMSI